MIISSVKLYMCKFLTSSVHHCIDRSIPNEKYKIKIWQFFRVRNPHWCFKNCTRVVEVNHNSNMTSVFSPLNLLGIRHWVKICDKSFVPTLRACKRVCLMISYLNIYFLSMSAAKTSFEKGLSGFRDPAPQSSIARPAHSFVETWSWKHFYGHSPSSTDSRRAVVSYWRKNVH